MEEKEKQRANRIRAEMLGKGKIYKNDNKSQAISSALDLMKYLFSQGRPVAPYNTTQFLMEEHDPFDSDTFDPSSGTWLYAVTCAIDTHACLCCASVI